ncbi:MAG: LysM peptidoglycan-binding domain-containing protein [Opitutaceae bacterium]|nr:LysM peptidoglycan-binding domain-containing protein [Opitutaceae bacterium]
MKILHIFGAVVAVHLAVFLVIFAVPGCRTTGKSPASSSSSAESSSAAVSPVETSPLATATEGASPVVAYAAPTSVRFSPTRPGTAEAVAAAPASAVTNAKPATTYLVTRGDSLWSIAKKHGITVAELSKANNLRSNAALQIGQKLTIPAATAVSHAAASAGGADQTGPVHVVKSGETLGQIARMHGTTVNTLKRMNKLSGDMVRPGKVLLLPEGSVSSMDVAPAVKATPSTSSRGSNPVKHAVQPNETLGAIARRYGISVGELVTANNIQDPSRIRFGQELIIPGWSAPKSASAPAETKPAAQPEPAPITPAEQASPLTPVAEPAAQNNSQIPIIKIEDPSRTSTPESRPAP